MEISIIALPLIASIISGFFGKLIGDRTSELITSLLVTISAILSALVLYEVIFNQYQDNIIIASPIAASAAATVKINKVKTCPDKSPE